jgi:hypothetical protein
VRQNHPLMLSQVQAWRADFILFYFWDDIMGKRNKISRTFFKLWVSISLECKTSCLRPLIFMARFQDLRII